MTPNENPYRPPATNPPLKAGIVDRGRSGFSEGVRWGLVVGFAGGVIELFRGTTTWFNAIGGSLLATTMIMGLVFSIGRAVSGRLTGAWIGFAVGLFFGMLLGDTLGGYHWTTTVTADGKTVAVGTPVGQIVGSIIGLIVGALIGAIVDRVVRGVVPSDHLNH